jgi:hypothetical protein
MRGMPSLRARTVNRGGRRFRVRRRWLPWRRRVRDVPDVPDGGGSLGDDPISAILGIVLLILAIPAIVVTLLLLAELLLLLLLLPLGVAVRLLLPVPWTIEVWSRPQERRFLGWHLEHEVPVRGWSASRERMEALREEIAGLRPNAARSWVPEGRTGPARDEPGA